MIKDDEWVKKYLEKIDNASDFINLILPHTEKKEDDAIECLVNTSACNDKIKDEILTCIQVKKSS